MILNKKYIILIYCLCFLLPELHWAKEKKYHFGEIRIENERILFDFTTYNLFTSDILKGLQKGMTSAVEYQIQLWKVRPRWVDQLITERLIRMKIGYDNWEKKYVVMTKEGEPIVMHEDKMKEKCSRLLGFPICQLSDLNTGQEYLITIKVVLQPMSVENVLEIKRWLSGEMKEVDPKTLKPPTESTGKKAGSWLLGLVLNLTGFGDKVIPAKSDPFLINEGSVVLQKGE